MTIINILIDHFKILYRFCKETKAYAFCNVILTQLILAHDYAQ